MSEAGEGIDITESWHIVDQWWTATPKVSYWVALRAPDGDTIAVSYHTADQQWTFHGDPRPKIEVKP